MTSQEIFDTVVSHLRDQGSKSTSPFTFWGTKRVEDVCAYRGVDGKKCAAGCLISDEEYSLNMENHTFGSLLRSHDDLRKKYEGSCNLIDRLQATHDHFRVSDWEKEFSLVATEFSLTLIKKEEKKDD